MCNSGIRILRGGNIQSYKLILEDSDVFLPLEYRDEEKNIQPGDTILVASTGSKAVIGKPAFVDKEYPNTQIGAFLRIARPIDPIIADYIALIFETEYYREHIRHSVQGTNINNIKAEYIENLLIPLPPHEEQVRVLAKLSGLEPALVQYDNVENTLQSLNASFPEALLERIRAEKQRLIKEGKIKKDKHESVIFRRDNSHYEKRGSEEVCIDEEIPFEIPENWAWARLSSASISIADGDHQPPPQVQDGIPFLVISNVSDGIVDFSNTRYVPKKYFDSLAEIRIPQCGDLLFTVTGSYGIVIPVQTERKFCFQRHIALIKLGCLSSEFMRLWLSSPLVYEQCRRAATGTAQKTVGLASLKGLLIPIPPLNEQVRILQKLNTLLALAAL